MSVARAFGKTLPEPRQRPTVRSAQEMKNIAQQLAVQVSEQLPSVLDQLMQGGFDPENQSLQLECSLTAGATAGPRTADNRVQVAAVNIGRNFSPFPSGATPQDNSRGFSQGLVGSLPLLDGVPSSSSPQSRRAVPLLLSLDDSDSRPVKRRKDGGPLERSGGSVTTSSNVSARAQNGDAGPLQQRPKRISDNPALQPSTFDKFVSGVWDSIFSGVRMDPTEVIEQWQAIESNGQPKLLTNTEQQVTIRSDTGDFGRMNVLTRKISQTSRTCRSLEVIVQAHWVQCFEDRVEELATDLPREKAKRAAIAEACVDFSWTEKELRNKMAIWRGYHDIQAAGGWAALVFAGTGLYRFCKYRVSFTDETFDTLRVLRHRFEVAADTIHPRWRILLGIVGAPTQPKYQGHPHDWVVNGPANEAIPLPQTYHQWDENFSYTHLEESTVDAEAWGDYDPRTMIPEADPVAYNCQYCNERQSNDLTQNGCVCYPNLYGSPKASLVALQVFGTPNGKNNGLLACCPFEKGWAVGEFVGLITSGLAGKDVMIGQTDQHGMYQIWQGRQGNHTRFVNHSCQPNSHFERFVWLGKQRIVLVSRGIEAGQEVTVDYGNTYWEVSQSQAPSRTGGRRYCAGFCVVAWTCGVGLRLYWLVIC